MKPIAISTKAAAQAKRRRRKQEMRSAVAAGTLKVRSLGEMSPRERAAFERRLRVR